MKILFIADEEWEGYWDYFRKEDFAEIDLIVSCGDLKASYLSFLTTMTSIPLLYVHGNHDDAYESKPPEGCICIEDDIFEYEGVRFLGLGGCHRYKEGKNQYTEKQMERRVRRLWLKFLQKKGFDILVTHAPAKGINDKDTMTHKGFEVFNKLIKKYEPKMFVHGHVHMKYGRDIPREDISGKTKVINAFSHYTVEIFKE